MLPVFKSALYGAAAAVMMLGMAGAVQAQTAADNEKKVLEKLPAEVCQKERFEASANGGVGIFTAKDAPATRKAIKRWRADVTSKYGQKFGDWDNSFLGRTECFDTGVEVAGKALTRKCTVSAYPCSRKLSAAEQGQVGITSLQQADIMEMQRLINALLPKAKLAKKEKRPKDLKVDGGYGATSVAAMKFLYNHGLVALKNSTDYGPNQENLDALREATK